MHLMRLLKISLIPFTFLVLLLLYLVFAPAPPLEPCSGYYEESLPPVGRVIIMMIIVVRIRLR